MNLNIFYAYTESILIDNILIGLNSLNYFVNIFILTFLLCISLGMGGYAKRNYLKVNITGEEPYYIYYIPSAIALLLTIINYNYHVYLNLYCLIAYMLIIIGIFFINITRKSLKWFSLLFCIFIIVILSVYLGALELIARINLTGLEHFGLNNYEIVHKSLLEIYHHNDHLFLISYVVNNQEYILENDVVYKRIYVFYYFMNTMAVLFWLYVYHRLLKFHGIKMFSKKK